MKIFYTNSLEGMNERNKKRTHHRRSHNLDCLTDRLKNDDSGLKNSDKFANRQRDSGINDNYCPRPRPSG